MRTMRIQWANFLAKSVRLASPATERFLYILGQGKSRLYFGITNPVIT